MKLKPIDKLYKEVTDFFGVDLKSKDRETLIVNARYVFFVQARLMRCTMQQIANMCNKSHGMVWKAEHEHDDNMLYNRYYRESYNAFINRIDKKEEKSKNIILTEAQKTLLSDLKQLSNSDILEFRETRLKPYLNMLKTRVKQKQVHQVAGARLIR